MSIPDFPSATAVLARRDGWADYEVMETREQTRRAIIRRTKEAREKAGYSQPEMADLLGISAGTYPDYEQAGGKKRATVLPPELVYKFCLITSTNLDWLFGGKGPRDIKATMRRSA